MPRGHGGVGVCMYMCVICILYACLYTALQHAENEKKSLNEKKGVTGIPVDAPYGSA